MSVCLLWLQFTCSNMDIIFCKFPYTEIKQLFRKKIVQHKNVLFPKSILLWPSPDHPFVLPTCLVFIFSLISKHKSTEKHLQFLEEEVLWGQLNPLVTQKIACGGYKMCKMNHRQRKQGSIPCFIRICPFLIAFLSGPVFESKYLTSRHSNILTVSEPRSQIDTQSIRYSSPLCSCTAFHKYGNP